MPIFLEGDSESIISPLYDSEQQFELPQSPHQDGEGFSSSSLFPSGVPLPHVCPPVSSQT
jgi:hypothetical protein